jgi:hypothetical protein
VLADVRPAAATAQATTEPVTMERACFRVGHDSQQLSQR